MKDTICWECANACGGCSWSRKKAKPVPGWDAIRHDLYGGIESYIVISCPEFAPDEKAKNMERRVKRCKSHHSVWTDEELQTLYAMRSDGKTVQECAKLLGRTYLSVAKKIEREKKRVI